MIANPLDMIFLKRAVVKQKFALKPLDSTAMNRAAHLEEDEHNRVEDIVEKYFEEADPSKSLQVIPTKGFSELCRRLVVNDDDDAAERIIKFYSDKACEYLNENMPAEENIDEALNNFRNSGNLLQSMLNMLDTRGVRKRSTALFDNPSAVDNSVATMSNVANPSPQKAPAKTASTRGRGSTRGSTRGGRGTSRGAASSSKTDLQTSKTNGKAQPSVASMFSTNTSQRAQASTATRTSQRPTARKGNFTQYIEDSDSD